MFMLNNCILLIKHTDCNKIKISFNRRPRFFNIHWLFNRKNGHQLDKGTKIIFSITLCIKLL